MTIRALGEGGKIQNRILTHSTERARTNGEKNDVGSHWIWKTWSNTISKYLTEKVGIFDHLKIKTILKEIP